MKAKYSRGYFEEFLSGIEAPQPSVSSRKAVCQFRVTTSWAQFRNWASYKNAPARSAPSSTALKKFAPSRWARDRFAWDKFVPLRSACRRSARERSNPLKSSPRRPAWDKSGVSSFKPCSGWGWCRCKGQKKFRVGYRVFLTDQRRKPRSSRALTQAARSHLPRLARGIRHG